MKNKTLFITGGTGSFGQKFIERCISLKPKKIIIFSRDELKQYDLKNKLVTKKNNDLFRFFIGDVRDKSRMEQAMEGVDYVIHAAALKQVPTAEYNPFETIKTNIIGAQNVIESSLKNNVKKVIALSTDKATAPINLYGATKLASDKLFLSANNIRGSKKTIFSVVRYGNVLNSRGSVVPLFKSFKKKGYVPITDLEMTRFNITLSEGVKFVERCLKIMTGGELFVPKIPSFKIVDLASAILPNAKKKIIGLRPGEKIHEEMITETDALNTFEFKDHYVILSDFGYTKYKNRRLEKAIMSKGGKKCKKGFSYNSKNNKDFLDIKKIKNILKINS